jgi:hypothetical protein
MRASVIRAGRRASVPPGAPAAPAALAAPAAPPPPGAPVPPQRTAEQILRDNGARVTALYGRVGRNGSLTQQIAAQRLQTLRLPVSLAGVTVAFQSLTKALEARSSTNPAFKPLLADAEALAPRVEWLESAMGAVDTLNAHQRGRRRHLAALADRAHRDQVWQIGSRACAATSPASAAELVLTRAARSARPPLRP